MEPWIASDPKVRRNKYAILLGLAIFPVVLLFSLYYLYRNIDSLETTLHQNVVVLSAKKEQIDNAHHAQAAFALQIQEWKDLLLRGQSAQDIQRYWTYFQQQESEVRNSIEAMIASARNNHEEFRIAYLKSILDAHQEIGGRYRDALSRYSLAQDHSAAFQIDRAVRDIDRSFAAELARISEDAAQEYKGLAARIIAAQAGEIQEVQNRVELNLIFIALVILLDALVILRTVSRSARELNQLADESEKTVYQLAYSDPLTGLPNRRLFQDRLERAIAQSNRSHPYRALMFLDLDNFKTLNDTKGHAMGDLLLIEVAKRLKDSVRVSDTLARVGGDEFVVLLGELSENRESASEQAMRIAEKISHALNQPYQLNELLYSCSASIGVTMFRNEGITIEEVHKRADAAMYQAKNAGRNTVRFFDPKTQAALEARSELEHALRIAVAQQQLRMYFQIQVDEYNRPVGAEVLLRWLHPELGMVFPGQFIGIAEETGLILPIGQWLLESACRQIKLWEDDPQTRDLQLAVNVSARQFHQPKFVTQVRDVIKKTGINPSRLKLELTESMVLADINDTVLKMRELKEAGVRFSMDDFGTGYSSLSYLTQLPLDQLKVDQSFVRNIGIKSTDAIIVQTIIGMANNLNLEPIAEGVETQAQRDFLEKAGCTRYQGYLFGKPEPLEKFTDALLNMNTLA